MGQGTVHDMSTPEGMSPPQMRPLWTLHEKLARDFGAALSSLLRTAVDVTLKGVDQVTYGQFVYNLESPSCFHVLKAEPWDDRLMLDIEPSILHPMIDRLLGGAAEDEPPRRPLTDIEWCLAARIVRVFLEECRSAWRPVVDLKFDVLQVESNPRLLRILPADELVVLVGFEVAIGELRGMVRFCLPCRALERLGDRLLPEHPVPINQPGSDPLAAIRVTLAETQISARELADLRVGDIIATETAADSLASVSIEGATKFRAKPGTYQGRKAIRLTETIENPKGDGKEENEEGNAR
jgi:flagellar motor switch protein FliM